MKVLLFASAREAARGASEIEWDPDDLPPDLASLLQRLGEQFPPLRRLTPHARIALNGQYVKGPLSSVRLRISDEVALLPPYSGG